MLNWAIYGMVFLGSLLMVYNIYGYITYARDIQRRKGWDRARTVLYVPIMLLVMFLLGYLAVGIIGKPDLIVSGILFGGSIYVFIMYRFLCRVTRRIQENEQMEARLMAAELSNRAKTEFLSSISHEMRTPMNAIIGLDTIALQDEDLKPPTRDRLEKIGVSARHLLELINDVLDINAIESGQLVVKREPFSMRETLALINLLIQARCDEKGLEYRHEASEDIEDTYIGDSLRLKQALLSVLDNAVKFTPAPGTVSFTAEQAPASGGQRKLRFTISDTGVGMDAEFIPRLFDSFAREDASATDRYGGSGLGLFFTKQLVERMGGDIDVTSEKGVGSTFVVTVALGEAEQPAETEEKPDLRGRRALIVEDIDLNAEILADLLELEEIESERAENGQVAVELFSGHPVGYYDVILMDLRMPVMDGLAATRAIRALDRPDAGTVPIIALTANAMEEDIRQSLAAGMNAHLSKPADIEHICTTLAKYVQ